MSSVRAADRRELRLHALGCAGHAHRDAIGLSRDADARFRFDVEERLDAVGVRESSCRASQVAPAFEFDFAANRLRLTEDQRPTSVPRIVRVGAGHDARLIVVDGSVPAP